MRISKAITIILLMLCPWCLTSVKAEGISMQHLGDSINAWVGFSPRWAASIKVKNLRTSGDKVTVRTSKHLKEVRWTPENVAELKRKISYWTLGHYDGEVTLQAENTNVESFITDFAKGILTEGTQKDLTEHNIALWPSHGLYYKKEKDEWIWQRATLWTTVEDLYSQEYVRLIKRMLENAGATVYMPRAGLDQQELGVSGMPQWTEGARYWLMSQGTDPSIWKLYDDNEYYDDMKCRPTWINSLKVPIDLCLAFHTDGINSDDDSTIVGTLAIYTARDDDKRTKLKDGRDRETTNRNMADYIQTQVTEDLRHIAPEWTRRQLKEANYGETRVAKVPCMILELLSHSNMADMKYGLDPNFRFTAARAVYKGILRYIDGEAAVVQPLPIQELSIDTKGVLRWQAQTDPLEESAKPTYYMVYTQENDGEWNVQQVGKTTSLQMQLKRGVRYTYYVVAGNEGGLSFPSPVISAYLSERDDAPTALIVDGFSDSYGPQWFADSTYAGIVPDSYACENHFTCAYIGDQWDYSRTSTWKDDDNCGWGSCYRDHAGQLTVGNTHDWAALHGRALRRMRISYVSSTEKMAQIDSSFTFVDVVCGRQLQPLGEDLRTQLAEYLDANGRLLLSTDHYSAIDTAWARQYLQASYHAARATRSGRIKSPLHRVYQLLLEPNDTQLFTCTPEGLKAAGENAVKMATYEDMRCPAAIGTDKTLVYGFPLEAVMDFDKIYKHSVEWLLNK